MKDSACRSNAPEPSSSNSCCCCARTIYPKGPSGCRRSSWTATVPWRSSQAAGYSCGRGTRMISSGLKEEWRVGRGIRQLYLGPPREACLTPVPVVGPPGLTDQACDRTPAVACHIGKKEFQRVSITSDRTGPESFLRFQVVFEKCKYQLPHTLHWVPPLGANTWKRRAA